jgi:outer membrane protein
MRFAIVCLVLTMLATLGCKSGGKPVGIAVINSRDVVTKCNDGMRVSDEIQRDFADRRNDLKNQEDAIRKLQNDLALPDPKTGKKDELQRLIQAYSVASLQFRQDVANEEAVKFKPVLDKVNKVLAEFAKEHGLVAIHDKNGFAYVDPSIDITDEILKRVDQVK